MDISALPTKTGYNVGRHWSEALKGMPASSELAAVYARRLPAVAALVDRLVGSGDDKPHFLGDIGGGSGEVVCS